MKDELEKYIENNRLEFNSYNVDEIEKVKLWSKIDRALAKTEKKAMPLWKRTAFRVAASIVVFIACTVSFLKISDFGLEHQIVNQELHQIDNHYKTLVDNQIQLIKTNSNLNDKEKVEFLTLVDDLDKEYKKLKTELKEGINDQKIIEAIIKNYKKKIQLMEDLLERSYPSNNNYDSSEIIL